MYLNGWAPFPPHFLTLADRRAFFGGRPTPPVRRPRGGSRTRSGLSPRPVNRPVGSGGGGPRPGVVSTRSRSRRASCRRSRSGAFGDVTGADWTTGGRSRPLMPANIGGERNAKSGRKSGLRRRVTLSGVGCMGVAWTTGAGLAATRSAKRRWGYCLVGAGVNPTCGSNRAFHLALPRPFAAFLR